MFETSAVVISIKFQNTLINPRARPISLIKQSKSSLRKKKHAI